MKRCTKLSILSVLFILQLCISGCIAFYTSYELPVTVVDIKTKQPLSNVRVEARPSYLFIFNPPDATVATTDENGRCTLKYASSFHYYWFVKKEGYVAPHEFSNYLPADPKEVTFELIPDQLPKSVYFEVPENFHGIICLKHKNISYGYSISDWQVPPHRSKVVDGKDVIYYQIDNTGFIYVENKPVFLRKKFEWHFNQPSGKEIVLDQRKRPFSYQTDYHLRGIYTHVSYLDDEAVGYRYEFYHIGTYDEYFSIARKIQQIESQDKPYRAKEIEKYKVLQEMITLQGNPEP